MNADLGTTTIDDLDHARAQEYALLATLLARNPDAAMLQRLALLDGDDSPLGLVHASLALPRLTSTKRPFGGNILISLLGSARGTIALRVVLPSWLALRPTSGTAAANAGRAGHREDIEVRTRGSRGDRVRDYGRARRRDHFGTCRG